MKTKAIFLDVDGTLISFKTHKIPQTTIDALNQVHNNGIKIIIATGRVATDLGELDAIPYDAVVSLNGSHCLLRDGTEITSRQISHEDFRIVRNLAEKYGFPLALEVDKGIFVNYVNDTVIALSELTNHPIPLVVDIDKEFNACKCRQLCIYCGEDVEKEIINQWEEFSDAEVVSSYLQKFKEYQEENDRGEDFFELFDNMLEEEIGNENK